MPSTTAHSTAADQPSRPSSEQVKDRFSITSLVFMLVASQAIFLLLLDRYSDVLTRVV